MDPKVEILLKEYENLRREELLHKESLRRIYLIIATAVTTFIGSFRLGEEVSGIASTLLVPIVLISIAYGLNDLYSIFLIARHVEVIEERVNGLVGVDNLLSWETQTCRRLVGSWIVTIEGPPKVSIVHPSIFANCLVAVFGVPAVIFASVRVLESIQSPWFQGFFLFGLVASVSLVLVLSIRIFRLIGSGGPLKQAIRAQYSVASLDTKNPSEKS